MRMILAAALLTATALPAVAGATARFLGDGIYATEEGCTKLKALAAGAQRNLNTVPETLDANGYAGWEHGCIFTSIKEVRKSKNWRVGTRCNEGPEKWSDTEAFERNADGSFTVTNTNKKTKFVRCETSKAK